MRAIYARSDVSARPGVRPGRQMGYRRAYDAVCLLADQAATVSG